MSSFSAEAPEVLAPDCLSGSKRCPKHTHNGTTKSISILRSIPLLAVEVNLAAVTPVIGLA